MTTDRDLHEIQIISFYRFQKLEPGEIETVSKGIAEIRVDFDVRGLFILGVEGWNSTLSVCRNQADGLKSELKKVLGANLGFIKESFGSSHPFGDLKVKVKGEIVTAGRPDLFPPDPQHRHLSPEEWHRKLHEPDTIVVDTRNSYEYEIGHFRGALNPGTREFTQFPKWLAESRIPKDKPVLIYCTGGIRCEKALLEFEENGYSNVHQLDGGILNYLAKFPNADFEGECFVFDTRVAVDQSLKPTKIYKLCPHCGQPANVKIDCTQCGTDSIVCASCLNTSEEYQTCSKNCAHHFRMGRIRMRSTSALEAGPENRPANASTNHFRGSNKPETF